jgi:ParB-like chromosome segregation protein Spo0J
MSGWSIRLVSRQDFQFLKNFIKEHGYLLTAIVLNQDNIVLDGHNRMRARKELGLPFSNVTS